MVRYLLLIVRRFALLRMDIARAFHAGTVGMNQEAGRFSARIKVLMPGEDRNDQGVSLLPIHTSDLR